MIMTNINKKIKYGVKLLTYKGQEFNMWIFEDATRLETSEEEAIKVRREYENRNPDGFYTVERIED